MDPFTLGMDAVGLGFKVAGLFGGMDQAKRSASLSYGIAQDEQKINAQKYQQMLLESHRRQMENFRNIQRQRSMATAAAVNQGAQFGTGLFGGLAQISDQGGVNDLGINQSKEIGTNIFNLNNDISNKKIQQSFAQSNMATDQSLMSLGGSMLQNSGTFGNLSTNAFNDIGRAFALFKPGSLSGGLT